MEKQQSMTRQQSSPSLSLPEWESIFDDFGSGSAARRIRWLHLPLVDLATQAILRRDFPSHLKPSVFLFIDDLLASPSDAPSPLDVLPPIFDALRSLLSSSSAPSAVGPSLASLRDQFMATAVSAAISTLDTPLDRASAALIKPLAESLLTVANRPNRGPDRQSRAAACECLRQLESAFPCLLADAAGHLWGLAQGERTHAAQSYLLLLVTIVRDLVLRPGLLSSPTSIFSTAVPLVPFNAPSCLFSDPAADRGVRKPSDVNSREIKKVLALLWEWPQIFTPAATMELVSILTSIAGALEQHVRTMGALLKVQFSGLIYSYDPILCHAVLMLYSGFPDAFADDDERRIARRLALMAREPHQPLVFRLLGMHWLLGSRRLGKGKQSLAPLVPRFYPAVLDPLALKAKKLDALACAAASLDGLEMRKVEEEDRRALKMKLFQDGLVCISAFKWLPAWSSETSIAFRTLHKFLTGIAPHQEDCADAAGLGFLMDSTIFNTLQTMLVNLAFEHPGLVPVIGTFVDRLLKCKIHQIVGERLLQKLDEHLLPKLEKDHRLISYFPIFEMIAQHDTIPPRHLLELLSKHIVSLTEKHGPDSGLGLWSQGTKLLGICRVMLKHHHSSRVFLPLSSLLVFICRFFPDLEIRDSARIYLRMLLCISGKKLRQVLHPGEQTSAVSPASHSGSNFQVSASEDLKMSGDVSYIYFERVIPLLVKQSWSLALFKSDTGENVQASSVVSISDVSTCSSLVSDGEVKVNLERLGSTNEPLRVMDSKVAEIAGVLLKHFSCIPDYRHMPAIKIRIPCVLRFDSESFNRYWGDGSSTIDSEDMDALPAMYATTITFSSTSKYGSIPPCRVPFLLGQPLRNRYDIVPAGSSFVEDPNHCASVIMELEPQEPMPGFVSVTIKANAENGHIISGKLQSIAVGIEDMFLKAGVLPGIEKGEVPQYFSDLFHALWEACGNSANTGLETFPLSGGKGAAAIKGTRSVKLLEVSLDYLIKNVEKHLASYVVGVIGDQLVGIIRKSCIIKDVIWENGPESFDREVNALVPYSENAPLQLPYFGSEGDRENISDISKRTVGIFQILIFLPPRFHLLFQMEVGYSSTLVRIRTDHWPCLAYVDEYLESLFLT